MSQIRHPPSPPSHRTAALCAASPSLGPVCSPPSFLMRSKMCVPTGTFDLTIFRSPRGHGRPDRPSPRRSCTPFRARAAWREAASCSGCAACAPRRESGRARRPLAGPRCERARHRRRSGARPFFAWRAPTKERPEPCDRALPSSRTRPAGSDLLRAGATLWRLPQLTRRPRQFGRALATGPSLRERHSTRLGPVQSRANTRLRPAKTGEDARHR